MSNGLLRRQFLHGKIWLYSIERRYKRTREAVYLGDGHMGCLGYGCSGLVQAFGEISTRTDVVSHGSSLLSVSCDIM